MEKGQPSWSDTEAESDSGSKKERGNPRRRPVTVPRSVFLAGGEEENGTRPDRTGFKAPVVQLFARRELPGLPPTTELPQSEIELKKKKKRKKKGEAAVVELSHDQLATVIEFPRANQEDDDEGADEYKPLAEITLREGDINGGEVVYLRDYRRHENQSETTEASQTEASTVVGGRTHEQMPEVAVAVPLAETMAFRQQPEQQHQMRAETLPMDEAGMEPEAGPTVYQQLPSAAELAPFPQPGGAGGSGGGELPPPGGGDGGGVGEDPPQAFELSASNGGVVRQPLPQEWDPARIYREYAERDAEARSSSFAGGVSPSEQVVSKREHDDAVYRAEKIGQNRGVAAGLLAGWWLGRRFLRKKMNREFAAQTKEQNKKIQQTETTLHFSREEQEKQRAELARQRVELDNHQATANAQRTERARVASTATRSTVAERQLAGHESVAPETPGERAVVEPNQVARQPQPEQQPITSHDPNTVTQSSSWHRIEIDARTGRPVETPSFQYGQEYYRERAKESLPADQQSATTSEAALAASGAADSRAASHGSPGDSGAANATNTPGQPNTPTYVPSASTQGPPARTSRSSTGPIWPYLLALVVIVLCLAWLLA